MAGDHRGGGDEDGKGEHATEGLTALCEGLKGSSVTSLKCAPPPSVCFYVSARTEKSNHEEKQTPLCAHRLDHNRLGPEGGAALAEGLKGNSTLQSLS